MFQAPLRLLVYMLLIIVILLILLGFISWQPQRYECLGGWEYGVRDKVEVVRVSNLVLYAYPFTRDCPESQRYQPGELERIIEEVKLSEQSIELR